MARKKSRRRKPTARRSTSRSHARRGPVRRRRNAGGRKIPWKEILIASAAGVGALYLGTKIAETETFQDFTEKDTGKQALVQVGVGVLGAAGVYALSKSAPAALGVAAGLAGFAGYAYLNKSESGGSSVTVEAEGTTAGIGYAGRRARPALGCAAGACPASSCPTPDDMVEIRDEGDCEEDLAPGDLC